ncbi:MAG: phage major capsid protein, partial [Pseudomonadota bacterium]
VATGTLGGFDLNDPGDAIVDLAYALGADYRQNGTFVMNSKTAGEVRKMKDNQGRFLWVEGISEDSPARLLGYPVLLAEDMPDISQNSYSIAFGDFSRGYTIAERPDIRILRDPYSAKPNVAFFATKRVGGDVTDYHAIKLLKFGTS